MSPIFSRKELDMIKILSPHWYSLAENKMIEITSELTVLEIIAMDCFLDKKEGPAVDSLRRCLIALKNCNPYRMTKEYDDLIKL